MTSEDVTPRTPRGLRNRLIHRYEKVDVEILLNTIRRNKEDFKEYVKHILKYLR